MAVAMVRTVGSWRAMSSSMATSTVRCAVEPTRTVQRVLARKSTQLWISNSGDGAQLRCQAATLTAARELATADAAVERRGVEESRAALRDSFEAASVSGRAEECHPVWDEAMAAEAYEQSRMYYGRRGGGDAHSGMATTKVADVEEEDVQAQVGRSEAVAVQGAGRSAEALCEMATRAWRRVGDAERAEQLFLAALQLAPGDCAVQACYAQFLWQCDA
jgi:hypothetical protein